MNKVTQDNHHARRWGALLLTFLCLFVTAQQLSAQSYDEWVNRAVKATEADSLSRAVEYLRKAVSADPAHEQNVWVYTNMGYLQCTLQRYDEAMQSYTFALNVAPYHVPALLGRATLYMELGKLELARVDYSLVLDVEKDHEEALLMRAYIYKVQRQYKFAEADYKHLLQLRPDHFSARLGMAMLKQSQGERIESVQLLSVLITESAQDSERLALLYRARAEVEWESGRSDNALLDVEQSMKYDATQAEAYLLRGQIYLSQEKKSLAKRDFQKAQELGIPAVELQPLLSKCR